MIPVTFLCKVFICNSAGMEAEANFRVRVEKCNNDLTTDRLGLSWGLRKH